MPVRVLVACATTLLLLVLAAPAGARTGPVLLGTALNNGAFAARDPGYMAALERFESVTAESAMKIDELQPRSGEWEFERADAMVDWAHDHGKAVHGHNLVWCADEWLPDWLRRGTWTRESLLDVMRTHITTVMSRYRGRIASWDVVNEPFNADGTRRDCVWARNIGPDWIELALEAARAADPAARLYVNEYGADIPNARFFALEAMARDLVARGVPLDGIGLQHHLGGPGPLQLQTEEAMRRIEALGLAVHVSELDDTTVPYGGDDGHKHDQQAQAFQTLAAACAAVQACERITLWGVSDNWSWRGPWEMAVALDAQYRPKPGWHGLMEELRRPAMPASEPAPEAPAAPRPDVLVARGLLTVAWDPVPGARTYRLEQRDADDADWTPVATGIRGAGFRFTPERRQRQGTHRYRVRASDGVQAGPWSALSVDATVTDRTAPAPPLITPDRASEASAAGWHRDTVTVAFADGGDPPLPDGSPGSGVDPASIPAPQTFATHGTHTASGAVVDRTGSRSSAASLTVAVDTDVPALALECPATVGAGATAAARWSAGDAGSGLAGPATGLHALDVSAPGRRSALVEARDRVGHSTVASCDYDVAAPAAVERAPALRLLAVSRVSRSGRVAVRVLCLPHGPACRGRLALAAGGRSIGAAALRVPAGRAASVRVTLLRSAVAAVRRCGRLAVIARVRLDGAGPNAGRRLVLRGPSRAGMCARPAK
jgi:endo-1,4-beta-xylanase